MRLLFFVFRQSRNKSYIKIIIKGDKNVKIATKYLLNCVTVIVKQLIENLNNSCLNKNILLK